MLNLENILWVTPGVVFIYLYNRKRALTQINLSGWSYIFFLVLIATISWIPAKIITDIVEALCTLAWSSMMKKSFEGISWLPDWIVFYNLINAFEDVPKYIFQFLSVGLSIVFVVIHLSILTFLPIFDRFFPAIYDNFYKKCIEWENQLVILTLKNDKSYIATLWKYPEVLTSKYESQTISIVPSLSGYRDKETKEIIWNTPYPVYENKDQIKSMEIIIPRSEIMTFGKFNQAFFNSSNPLMGEDKSSPNTN